MYIDIHTHRQKKPEEAVLSVFNLNVPDRHCRCGLDLQSAYSLGIHPWKIYDDLLAEYIRYVDENAQFDSTKAIGECGLDKLTETPWSLQLRAFEAQISIGEKHQKPLIIHCVKAFDELIALRKEIQPQQAWIIHGFRGKPQQMEQLVKQGFLLSFGEHFNEETLQQIPLDRLLLETDESTLPIQEIYRKASSVLNISEDTLLTQIERNYSSLSQETV